MTYIKNKCAPRW